MDLKKNKFFAKLNRINSNDEIVFNLVNAEGVIESQSLNLKETVINKKLVFTD